MNLNPYEAPECDPQKRRQWPVDVVTFLFLVAIGAVLVLLLMPPIMR